MESLLYLVGSSMLRRQRNTNVAGIEPRPNDSRHIARRWSLPSLIATSILLLNLNLIILAYIQKSTRGTKAANTPPKVIMASSGILVSRFGLLKETDRWPRRPSDVGQTCVYFLPRIARQQRQNHKDIQLLFRSRPEIYFEDLTVV